MNFLELFTNLLDRAYLAEEPITRESLMAARELYIVEQQAHVAQVATLANKLDAERASYAHASEGFVRDMAAMTEAFDTNSAERDAALAALAECGDAAADSIIDAILAPTTGQRAAPQTKPVMQYNVCKTCGAKDGRAGVLIGGDCLTCYDIAKNKEGAQ